MISHALRSFPASSLLLLLLLSAALGSSNIRIRTLEEDTQAPALLVGERVHRGPNWRWGEWIGEQHGTVAGAADPEGWWWIRWDTGQVNAYRFSADIRDILPTTPTPLPAPRVRWPGHARAVAAGDGPVILTDTPAAGWAAMRLWDWPYLAEHVEGELKGVKVMRREQGKNATDFHYFHAAPMDSLPAVARISKADGYARANMSVAEFMRAAGIDGQEGNTTHAFAYTAMLDDWGLAFLRQVQPLPPFVLLPPGADAAQDKLYRQTRVWLSPAHSATPGHYDLFHNFYVQLRGRKRFRLWPPEQWPQLYLHPLLHPRGRATQVDVGPHGRADARFPLFAPHRVPPVVADLGPGDVLYLPPLWFHHVTSLEHSVSVSVWSHYVATEIAAKAVEEVVLPLPRAWTRRQKVAGLRAFVVEVLLATQPEQPGLFLSHALLDTRYRDVGCAPDADHEQYCYDGDAHDFVMESGKRLMDQQLAAVVAIFRRVLEAGTEARLPMYLADYVELIVNAVVGPAEVCPFLRALTLC